MPDQDQGVATWNVPISRMEAMMDASDLKSLLVVTIEGGDKVGIVNTILFNTADYRIQAFLMGRVPEQSNGARRAGERAEHRQQCGDDPEPGSRPAPSHQPGARAVPQPGGHHVVADRRQAWLGRRQGGRCRYRPAVWEDHGIAGNQAWFHRRLRVPHPCAGESADQHWPRRGHRPRSLRRRSCFLTNWGRCSSPARSYTLGTNSAFTNNLKRTTMGSNSRNPVSRPATLR